MKTCAVIVAGGRSSRMGREKALEMVRGRRIIDRIIATLSAQADAVAINANDDPSRYCGTGLPVFGDGHPGIGTPLAGLHAAVSHAARHGFEAVLTVPSDAPFLPADLLARLERPTAIAASGGQAHYLTGLWSPSVQKNLEDALGEIPPPRMQDWAKRCKAAVVEWPATPYDPFFNVNTPDELAEAERIAAEFAL